jgi:hypothetical protein
MGMNNLAVWRALFPEFIDISRVFLDGELSWLGVKD